MDSSDTLRALARALGGGATALYGHRQNQQAIQRALEAARQQREDQLARDRAEDQYRAGILGVQTGQLAETRRGNDLDFQSQQAQLGQQKVRDVVAHGKEIGYIPSNPQSYVAADELGFRRPVPIEEDMLAARESTSKERRNVELPGGQGTAIYDPGHMAGMSTYMGNFNRPGTTEKYSQRLARLDARIKSARDAFLAKYKFSSKFDLPPELQTEYDRTLADAEAQNMTALGIGRDQNGYYDLESGARAPAPPPETPNDWTNSPEFQIPGGDSQTSPPSQSSGGSGRYSKLFK